MYESIDEIIREAKAIIEKHGDVPTDIMAKVIANMPEEIKETLGYVIAIAAGLAMLSGGQFSVYNTEAEQYLTIRMSEDIPEGTPDGPLMNLGSGTVDGYIAGGVRVDEDGVTAHGKRVCVVCGQETCTDPSQCAERRNILAAVRGMGRAEPQEGLRNIEEIEDV